MKAAVIETFGGMVRIQQVADPAPALRGAVIKVLATGLCLSDWHAWMGHDTDIKLPHVPGHELAGVVEAVGKDVKLWKRGDAVTMPFVCACGVCPQCLSGNHQVCDHQAQPGFTHWGSFAEYVAIENADINLVKMPEAISFVTAASLGCRFATSFRAIVEQGKVTGGQWVAVHGCGGVGLSAIMIANAIGANVIGVDINDEKLAFARSIGAVQTINANEVKDVPGAIMEMSKGGAHVSLDALGNPATCFNSISCLRKRGKHIQVGLMLAEQSRPPIPMDKVVGRELEILGSHGMQAYKYDQMLQMILAGKLHPEKLICKTVGLEEALPELMDMHSFKGLGITVINAF